MTNWKDWLEERPSVRRRLPVGSERLREVEQRCGRLPPDLRRLYEETNGVSANTFDVLPIFEPEYPSKTWDSLERANDPLTSKYVDNVGFLNQFLIFADLGGSFAAFNRSDGSIWYSEGDDLSQTNLKLQPFLEVLLNHQ